MNQRIDKKEVINQFNLKLFGAKGWMSNKSIQCPEPACGRTGKFGVMFNNNGGGVCHCFYCDSSLSIFSWLRKIGLKELIQTGYENSSNNFIEGLTDFIREDEAAPKEVKEVDLPLGFKRLYDDEYLNDRGFVDWQYEQFQIGYTDSILEPALRGYIIFQLFQKGKLVGWLARSRKDYEWHKKNLEGFKAGECDLVLRYMNNEGIDFNEILGGFDDINSNTHTLILVEGITDKANLDRLMQLNESDEIKCCFTFGNKVSDGQLKLIKETNVETIILMFDPDAIKQMQHTSPNLHKNKFKVLVADLEPYKKDAGDINKPILMKVLKNLKNYLYFYISKI